MVLGVGIAMTFIFWMERKSIEEEAKEKFTVPNVTVLTTMRSFARLWKKAAKGYGYVLISQEGVSNGDIRMIFARQ
jgi:hypothetical protein